MPHRPIARSQRQLQQRRLSNNRTIKDLETLPKRALAQAPIHTSFFKRLTKSQLKRLDSHIHTLHQQVFDRIDCLECGNCCRSLGPRIGDRDIDKIAAALRIKPHEVVSRYLRIDEDNDYIFQSMPCPFLGADNYCSIYSDRPKACREYPHTDRKRFIQIQALTIRNAHSCPAVLEILNQLVATLR